MVMKITFQILFMLLISKCAMAQIVLKGEVTDSNGEPLLGVNVFIRDSYNGSSTDDQGTFMFITQESGLQIIVASCIGYKTHQHEVALKSKRIEVQIVLEEEIHKIDGVAISAGAFEASEEKTSVVLKTLDIITTAGATADVSGVMNTLPGTQTVGEDGRLFVRGGNSYEAKAFINGLLVAVPYGFTPQNIPSRFRFNPFLFKGAFFSTGGFSVEYGQALSSIMQLNTYDLPMRSQTDISLMTLGLDISQTIRKNNTSAYGQIQYTDLTAYYSLVPQKEQWERPPRSLNTTFHLKQKIGSSGKIKTYNNFDRSAMVIHQPLPGNIYQVGRYDITSQNLYSNTTIKNLIGESMSYRGGIAYTNTLNLIQTDDARMEERVNGIHSKFAVDQDISENLLLTYGSEYFYDKYTALTYDQDGRQISGSSIDNHRSSSFAEANVYFSNRFMARIGGRYEYNDIIDLDEFSPRASFAYKVNDNCQFSMALGRFSQLPIHDYLIHTSQLIPEIATHYILNYQNIKEGRIFRSEVYYKKYSQLVTVRKISNQTFALGNDGYGDAKGIELFWRDSKSFKNVDYWISYSYLDTERKYDRFSYPVTPSYASDHNISIVYKHFITRIKSQIGWTYSFASGRPYTDPNGGGYNSKLTKHYHDLSLNYSYLMKPNMILHVAVSNVFGFKNIFGYRYNSEPNEGGIYESIPIESPAKRFIFLGFFITLSKDKNANQLNNL